MSAPALRKLGASCASRPAAVSSYWANQVRTVLLCSTRHSVLSVSTHPRLLYTLCANAILPQHAAALQQAQTAAPSTVEKPEEVASNDRPQYTPQHVRYLQCLALLLPRKHPPLRRSRCTSVQISKSLRAMQRGIPDLSPSPNRVQIRLPTCPCAPSQSASASTFSP